MSNHQKRLSAPKQYPIERKEGTYVAKGKGPHAAETGLPLVVVLRDILEVAESEKEAKQILHNEQVQVDGRTQKNPLYTVGFMDVIQFPETDDAYRMLIDVNGFVLTEIDDADQKLVRVEDKTTLIGGVTQLNLADGNNIEVDEQYSTQSSLLVSLPDLAIEQEVPFEEGNLAYISGGKHAGVIGTITAISEQAGTHPRTVAVETDDDETVETVEEHVYMVGGDNAEVDVHVTE